MKVAEKRTQIYFPLELYRKIERIAKDQSRSFASVTREAVERYFKEHEAADWEKDPFFKIAGIADSGKGDLAEKHDRYLYGKGKK